MNATIRLVISDSSQPPASGCSAGSWGPAPLITELVWLC
jgi:hypothetical protein